MDILASTLVKYAGDTFGLAALGLVTVVTLLVVMSAVSFGAWVKMIKPFLDAQVKIGEERTRAAMLEKENIASLRAAAMLEKENIASLRAAIADVRSTTADVSRVMEKFPNAWPLHRPPPGGGGGRPT